MRFRYFLPLALLAGALVGIVSARAPLERAHADLLGSPFTAGGGGGTSIAFQNQVLGPQQTSTANYNFSYTNVSNSNTGLIAAFFTGGNQPMTSVSYNSVACANVGTAAEDSSDAAFVWYCPVGTLTPGAHSLSSNSSVANTSVTGCVWEYSGAAQTTATENVTPNTGVSATATASFTPTTSNDWGILITASTAGAATSAGGGYTFRATCGDYADSNGVISGAQNPTLIYGGSVIWGSLGFGLKHG